MYEQRWGTVRIRRNIGLQVKPEAEQLDGKRFLFEYGWPLEDDHERYTGETAWLLQNAPRGAPTWIADGDIEFERAGHNTGQGQ
jgi:hypothetical protein